METKSKPQQISTRVALHPFLAGMNQGQLALLSDCAMIVHFAAGQLIFQEGEHANRFYLIESGQVALESSNAHSKPVVIDSVGPGGLLGWSWMFPPHVWHFTARAVAPTVAIFFYGTILREYCDHDHSLGYELFKRMSAVMVKRLQGARDKMLAIDTRQTALQPAIVQLPFMDQELDTATNVSP